MLRVIVLRESILDVGFRVYCLIIVEVLQRVGMIHFSHCGFPYFIGQLQLFALLEGGIGQFPVGSKSRVPHCFIYH